MTQFNIEDFEFDEPRFRLTASGPVLARKIAPYTQAGVEVEDFFKRLKFKVPIVIQGKEIAVMYRTDIIESDVITGTYTVCLKVDSDWRNSFVLSSKDPRPFPKVYITF